MIKALVLRRVPTQLIHWIASFMSHRKAKIKLNKELGEEFSAEFGLPQGSPLSPLLYIIFNASLVELLNSSEHINLEGSVLAISYIDDIHILVSIIRVFRRTLDYPGPRTNLRDKLQKMIDIAVKWGDENNAKFDMAKAKSSFIYFDLTTRFDKRHSRRKKADAADMPAPKDKWYNTLTFKHVNLYGQDIESVYTTKYLGLILDSELNFEYHFNHMIEKAKKSRTMLSYALRHMGLYWRKKALFQVLDPKINYAVTAWYSNIKNEKTKKYFDETLLEFHRETLKVIAGFPKKAIVSIPTRAMELEFNIFPPDIRRNLLISASIRRMRLTNNNTHLIGTRRSIGISSKGSIFKLTDDTPQELRIFSEADVNFLSDYKKNPPWAQDWSIGNEANTGSATNMANGLWRVDHGLIPNKRIELYKELNKQEALTLLKLRTTHNNIGAYLALRREGIEEDDANDIKYQCHFCNNEVVETFQHIAFECPTFNAERTELLNNFINQDISKILSNKSGAKAMAKFMNFRNTKVCSLKGCKKCTYI